MGRLPLALLCSWVLAGCVVRPALDGRACDEEHPCVAGYHCADGACVAGAAPSPADAGDGGHLDAGSPDGGSPDGGSPDDGGYCPLPAPEEQAWLTSFTLSPASRPPPGGTVEVAWETVGMDGCSLRWLDGERASLPSSGTETFYSQVFSKAFLLQCTAGDEVFEASRVYRVGPGLLDIDAGLNRTCAVLEGGVVKCWGAVNGSLFAPAAIVGDSPDEVGELLRVPLQDPGGEAADNDPRAVRVFVGSNSHACALLDDGRLKCWGENEDGQLGVESTTNAWVSEGWDGLLPARLGARGVESVALGTATTCAAFDDGSVGCWGHNASGVLGLGVPASEVEQVGHEPGTMGEALQTFRLDDEAAPVALSAAGPRMCALLDDSSLKCWGSNTAGALGLGDTSPRGDDEGEVGPTLAPVEVDGPVAAISLGSMHTCAVVEGMGVKCWGRNSYGELGRPTDEGGAGSAIGDEPGEMGAALPPVDLGTGVVPRAVAVGGLYSCAALNDGKVKCWGANGHGQLGVGDTETRGDDEGEMGDALPFADLGGGYAYRLVSGAQHTCAWFEGNRVKCWGNNSFGQLGLGDTDHRGDEPGEMGGDLPFLDFGPLDVEAFTLDGARAALERQGCASCHAAALPAEDRAYPPLDGCAPERLSAYPPGLLEGLAPESAAGRRACLHWHLTEECAGGDEPRRVDPARPDHSLLLREPYCADRDCVPAPTSHPPVTGFAGRGLGSDFAYLFHWIARGAPDDG